MKHINDYKQELDIQNYSDRAFKEAILEIVYACGYSLEQIQNTASFMDGKLYDIYNRAIELEGINRTSLDVKRASHTDIMNHMHGIVTMLTKPKEEVKPSIRDLIKNLLTTKI